LNKLAQPETKPPRAQKTSLPQLKQTLRTPMIELLWIRINTIDARSAQVGRVIQR
jgi:hypothetical protein